MCKCNGKAVNHLLATLPSCKKYVVTSVLGVWSKMGYVEDSDRPTSLLEMEIWT